MLLTDHFRSFNPLRLHIHRLVHVPNPIFKLGNVPLSLHFGVVSLLLQGNHLILIFMLDLIQHLPVRL